MVSLAYARDLSRAYAVIARTNYLDCLDAADPLDCFNNGPNVVNKNPILAPINKGVKTVADIPNRISKGGQQTYDDAAKNIGKPIQDDFNNLNAGLQNFAKSVGGQFAPCKALGKYGMMFPIPCWLLGVFGILGALIILKAR